MIAHCDIKMLKPRHEGDSRAVCSPFGGRWDYAVVGTVVNLAARLCSEARSGEIIVDRSVVRCIECVIETEPAGDPALKGFALPVPAHLVKRLRTG